MNRLGLVLLAIGCHQSEEAAPVDGICRGEWVHSTDGVPDTNGFEVLDAEGRTVESGNSSPQHTWMTWETDASGTDRLVEVRWEDDDSELVVTWEHALDDRLRLAWVRERSTAWPVRETTYVYDDDDREIEIWHTADGAPEGATFHTWEDGRLLTTENVAPSGEVVSRYSREYLEPAPSLDRLETLDGWGLVQVVRVDADDQGRLIGSWRVVDGEERRYLRQEWDGDHVVDSVMTLTDAPGAGVNVVGEMHTTTLYGRDGLVFTDRVERDDGPDGTVDSTDLTAWDWTCE